MKRINIVKFLIALMTSLFYFNSLANTGICKAEGGAHQYIYNGTYDVTSAAQNESGKIFEKVFNYALDGSYNITCDVAEDTKPAYILTKSDLPIYQDNADYTWYKVDDSIAVAMESYVAGGTQKYFKVPFIESNNGTAYAHTQPAASGSKGNISLMLIKPFVGSHHINKMIEYTKVAAGREGFNNIFSGPNVSELWMTVDVTVPQSCELDAGTTITMDFGNIGAPLFSQAGAGKKPDGVDPKTHNVSIKCKNFEGQALLAMRLEANNVSGNAIVSDNKDVGFVVADGSKKPLTPNDVDSKINFQLDGNSSATIPITAWPVSITGNKPAEGKFTSEGYLLVEFD